MRKLTSLIKRSNDKGVYKLLMNKYNKPIKKKYKKGNSCLNKFAVKTTK